MWPQLTSFWPYTKLHFRKSCLTCKIALKPMHPIAWFPSLNLTLNDPNYTRLTPNRMLRFIPLKPLLYLLPGFRSVDPWSPLRFLRFANTLSPQLRSQQSAQFIPMASMTSSIKDWWRHNDVITNSPPSSNYIQMHKICQMLLFF